MNPSRLPDDLRRWPGDEFELLGVARDVDSRALRQAYTQLIRQYNPERFPQHFQRIRQAYEVALKFVRWREANAAALERNAEPHDEPRDEGVIPADLMPAAGAPFRFAKVANLDDELEELWGRACAGEEAAVYDRLSQLERQERGSEEVLLRLFWLLVAEPRLDAGREPVDWLISGLKGNGPKIRLWRLYYQELLLRPAEVLAPRSAALFQYAASAGLMAELIRARWQAAAWLGEWQIIGGDVERLRAQMAQGKDAPWAGLLFDAADYLAWSTTPEGRQDFDRYCLELRGLEHLHFGMSGQFDRLETLMPIAEGWRILHEARGIPRVLPRVVSLSWTGPEEDARRELEGLVELLVSDLHAALRLLDRVMRLSPWVMWRLYGAMSCLPYEHLPSGETRPLKLFPDRLLSKLLRWDQPNYRKMRLPILELCLREAISPQEFAIPLAGWGVGPPVPGKTWTDMVEADLPLRCLYLAAEFHRA